LKSGAQNKMRVKKIAFFGIDGSGKSTLLSEVKKKFEKEKKAKVKVVYMGLGSEFNLPFLKQIMKISSKRRYGRSKVSQENLRKQNYRQRSFLWIFGQYSEFWLRYLKAKKWLRKNSEKSGKACVVLFDRYFYDGLILGSKASFNFFKHFTPKPDKSFLIQASPELIWKRKKEARPEEIKKYYKKAERLLRFFNIKKVDNVGPINNVVKKVWRDIQNG
jgi:thymidylate kinase